MVSVSECSRMGKAGESACVCVHVVFPLLRSKSQPYQLGIELSGQGIHIWACPNVGHGPCAPVAVSSIKNGSGDLYENVCGQHIPNPLVGHLLHWTPVKFADLKPRVEY